MPKLLKLIMEKCRRNQGALVAIGTLLSGTAGFLEFTEKIHIIDTVKSFIASAHSANEQPSSMAQSTDAKRETNADGEKERPTFEERFGTPVFGSMAEADAQFYEALSDQYRASKAKWPKVQPQYYAYAVDYYVTRPSAGLSYQQPLDVFMWTVWIKCGERYASREAREYCDPNRGPEWRLHNHLRRRAKFVLGDIPH
jgi:hypothetical protein